MKKKLFDVIFYSVILLILVLACFGLFYKTTAKPAFIPFFILFATYSGVYVSLIRERTKVGIKLPLILTTFTVIFTQLSGGELFPFYFILMLFTFILSNSKIGFGIFALVLACELLSQFARDSTHLFMPVLKLAGLGFFTVIFERMLKGRDKTEHISTMRMRTKILRPQPFDIDKDALLKSVKEKGASHDEFYTFESAVGTLLNLVYQSFRCNTVGLFLKEEGNLRLKMHKTDRVEMKQDGTLISEGTLVGWVGKTEKPILYNNFSEGSQGLGYYSLNEKVGSVLASPVRINDICEGVLAIDSKETDAFVYLDKERLSGFSRQISFILSYARARIQSNLTASYLSTLYELSNTMYKKLKKKEIFDFLINTIGKIFASDRICISFVDEKCRFGSIQRCEGERVFEENATFSLEESLIGVLVKSRNSIHFTDLTKREKFINIFGNLGGGRFKSFLGVPLLNEERVFGALTIESKLSSKYRDSDREILSAIGSLASIAIEKALSYEKVEEQAIKDGLTGLFNHRRFQEILSSEISKGKSLSLVMFDIDHFKELNDNYGHPAGDVILKGIAEILEKWTKGMGFAARYGGEEFAVVLPGFSKERGANLAERTREDVEKKRFKIDSKKIRVTISGGVASYPEDAVDKSTLIEKADNALYKSKELGRNRTTTAT